MLFELQRASRPIAVGGSAQLNRYTLAYGA